MLWGTRRLAVKAACVEVRQLPVNQGRFESGGYCLWVLVSEFEDTLNHGELGTGSV